MPFTKGHKIVGNRDGRPKGSRNKISSKLIGEFLDAIKEIEGDKKISYGKTFFKHIISRAFRNDAVAIALLRKLIPDQTFNVQDIQGEGVRKVIFEIVDAKTEQDNKKKGEEKKPDNNQNKDPKTD